MPCPLCGGDTGEEMADLARMLRVRQGHLILRCAPCGIARLEPRCTAEDLRLLYGPGYVDAYLDGGGGMAGGGAGIAPHLVRRIAAMGAPGRLLEVGCSRGHFLVEARRLGWRAIGVEFDHDAANRAREAGLEVRVGRIEDVPIEPSAYDAVHMNHVLEHLEDPMASLRILRDALRPGGRLVVEVPNEFDTLTYRIGRAFFPMSRRELSVPSPHQVFFTLRGLRRMLEQVGFQVDRIRTLRRAVGRPGEGMVSRLAKWLVYGLERPLGRAGLIEAWASRKAAATG